MYVSEEDIDLVARIVFGEARGESPDVQLAIAYTVINRRNTPGFPNTIYEVCHDRDCNGRHVYETFDRPDHNEAWTYAEQHKTAEYQVSIVAATDALLQLRRDPTYGSTNFAANDPDPATSSNEYYEASDKKKIGNYYFVYMISKQ